MQWRGKARMRQHPKERLESPERMTGERESGVGAEMAL